MYEYEYACVLTDRIATFDFEAMKKSRMMATSLKSTGQPKYALEEEVELNNFVCTVIFATL